MIRTQLHCHNCNGHFTVDFDDDKNGRHVVNCPNCNHEHCRIIVDGVVTEERWDSRNPDQYAVSGVYYPTYNYTGYSYTTSSSTSTATSDASWYAWSSIATST